MLFSIQPRAGLATGMEIRNAAEIVFDVNAPIQTSTWLNTIDDTPPQSAVHALAPTSPADFTVDWSGTDVGAGVRGYSVFVSDDAGPFEVWQQNTTDTSAAFHGRDGHAYAFYSVARDAAGNVEAAPTEADGRTVVATAPNPPANLGQFASDGTTAIPVGGVAEGTGVVLSGAVSGPAGRQQRIETEVKPLGTGFDGTGSASSAVVASGGTASVTLSGLAFAPYHWRARTVDDTGAASDWVAFGGNPESDADFEVRADIAFASTRTGNGDIYAIESKGGTPRQLTSGNAIDAEPEWSPDRAKVAFTSTRDGNLEIYVIGADGSDVTRLTTHSAIDMSPAWSPDGSKIAFASNRMSGNWDVYVMDADDGGNVTRLTTHGAADTFPAWSPDGLKIGATAASVGDGRRV